MARLDEIVWDDGSGLEWICAQGLDPIIAFAEVIIRSDDGNKVMDPCTFAYEIQDKAKAVKKCLYRFLDEIGGDKRLSLKK